ncbi:MAG: 50S ribosomal protein L28 [Acidimicrobiia bacterium]|nr:50S ribosomal protein L28 [Acidimicrobiia bacterium]
MSRVCQVTGRRPAFGKNVSHSHRRTNRRWNPNIQSKRYWVPSEQRWVTLKVSAKGIKVIDRRGIDSVVAELRRRGEKL